MARHRSDYEGELLTARCDTKIAPSDRARLIEAARETGCSASDLTRRFVLEGLRSYAGQKPHRMALKDADRATTLRLSKTGATLNDHARWANEDRRITDEKTLDRLSAELIETLKAVKAQPFNSPLSDERRDLLAAVGWVGNNVIQLTKIAEATGRKAAVAALDAVQAEIVKLADRATPR